ncbi:MAG: hypothetical protein K9K66_09515 [Desulfarculaceae bacterium]|nr:hypothetical protein [Desulfarculaceae bacterium]
MQALINLIRNAFFKDILPGFSENTHNSKSNKRGAGQRLFPQRPADGYIEPAAADLYPKGQEKGLRRKRLSPGYPWWS